MIKKLTEISLKYPRFIVWTTGLISLFMIIGIAVKGVSVDTDPENMLSEDEVVRVFHNSVKAEFDLNDMLVLGIVNEKDPDGVFNPKTLHLVYELTEKMKETEGVVDINILSPSTVDHIEQAGPGTVSFNWLMPVPPQTREGALAVRDKIQSNPMLKGTLVSEDGKALCLFVPLEKKDVSYEVSLVVKEFFKNRETDDRFFITGLPVAEDTFGVEMFKQMAISAPLAMLVIFILMFFFFRNLKMIISPMIVAIVSIIWTMGLLIITGHTVHIMSSMIPIFLMPIAVLDAVHILSDFFGKMKKHRENREKTMMHVMEELASPMLYTSLTTVVGFASMALTPIPPVQAFGIFVAFGVFVAWILTITFIPAYIMLLPESSLDHVQSSGKKTQQTWQQRMLLKVGDISFHRASYILIIAGLLIVFSAYGISRIKINDNPVKWFEKDHPIRVGDRILNEHFAGTYMAYMVLEAREEEGRVKAEYSRIRQRLSDLEKDISDYPGIAEARKTAEKLAESLSMEKAASLSSFYKGLREKFSPLVEARSDDTYDAWYEVQTLIDDLSLEIQVFKNPEVLSYMERLEKAVSKSGVVGKTNSLATLVKKVYMELMSGEEKHYRIPDTIQAVGQSLISFQNSHKPGDLWHLVTPDYSKANIWVQLKSGDNQDMMQAVQAAEDFMKNNPPPASIELKWAGLTYLNVVWQEKMVRGMLKSLGGSFIIVMIMMIFLFRSVVTGLLSMIPLTLTIVFIYALIGIMGKEYDMPIAILSSMTLGLSIDFAIHFLERSRAVYCRMKDYRKTVQYMFTEPAEAIVRNAIVVAIGFLPLLAAPLVPYKTVGFFLAGIMAVSSVATFLILPALIKYSQKYVFPQADKALGVCDCVFCSVASAIVLIIITFTLHHYVVFAWTRITWLAAAGIVFIITLCRVLSRHRICRVEADK